MKNHKENLFSNKFCLLNSQDNAEEINWSLSEYSDEEKLNNYDNSFSTTHTVLNRKRKRKKKVPKNISNLEVTILNVSKNSKDVSRVNTSPILNQKNDTVNRLSPILASSSHYLPVKKCIKLSSKSPILTSKNDIRPTKQNTSIKSPILIQKHGPIKTSFKVKKKLFHKDCIEDENMHNRSTSPIFGTNSKHLDKRKSNRTDIEHNFINIDTELDNHQNIISSSNSSSIDVIQKVLDEKFNVDIKSENLENSDNVEESNKKFYINDNFVTTKSSLELVKRVKSFFDNQFSSGNSSQLSISESLTPKPSTDLKSDDIEIISSATQVTLHRTSPQSKLSSKHVSPTDSYETNYNDVKSKKIRYKKNGLAHCLDTLLKKHNASISLWQHERYLAVNSKFVIPKEEHKDFRIKNAYIKYGCYLLDAVDINDEQFLILINDAYVNNNNLLIENAIFKLYQPYKVFCYDTNHKIIVNVCKFECIL